MKKILLLTFALLPFTALCQTFKLENGKELIPVDVWSQMKQVNAATPQEIQVAAGIDYIFVLVEIPNNTAGKTIRIQDTATKPPPTTPIKIEAEVATSMVNAAAVGTVLGHILPGAVIKYDAVDLTGKTKVRFRYSRGYSGSGTLIFKVGATSNTFTFPSTGGWATYNEIEFDIKPGSGVIEISSSTIGPANIDYFILY